MNYADGLKALLRPLGVYALDKGAGAGELVSVGAVLDACGGALEHVQQEMNLRTAQDEGMEMVERLLAHGPVTSDLARRREALAALLRVGGDSFTLAAINSTLVGCGLNAVASVSDTAGTVEVRFPQVPGIPDGFDKMKVIIEDILPCHLLVEYVFWYITWAMMEERFRTWNDVERLGLTWEELEELVR